MNTLPFSTKFQSSPNLAIIILDQLWFLSFFECGPKSGLNQKLATLGSLKRSGLSQNIFVTTKNQPIFICNQPANIRNS